MTASPLTSSEVEVPVDPHTAFTVFTDEIDLWWVRGPINFYDSGRVVAKRCEPGVGGRLLEVYDEATGEALELGRITVWEPGERLAWHSSVDDIEIDVRFEPTAGGTRVALTAHLPDGGTDRGGSAWVRVVPDWFGRWCAERGTAPRTPRELDRLAVAVHYAKPATAVRWLQATFGFDTYGPLPTGDEGHGWAEFRVGNCSLIVLALEGDLPDDVPVTHVPWIFVDDLDAHLARAEAAGATIVEPIHQHGYRAYTAADLEGHHWTFAQARPTMLG
jgi:uncharacterized glyoxalase superfamily protein PhnB